MQHGDLRFAHRSIISVRQQLQPLPQALTTLAAEISAGQSGLSAVGIGVDRLAYMLRGVSESRSPDQQVSRVASG